MPDLYCVTWMTAYTKRTLHGPAKSYEAAQSDLAFLADRYANIGQQYWLEKVDEPDPERTGDSAAEPVTGRTVLGLSRR